MSGGALRAPLPRARARRHNAGIRLEEGLARLAAPLRATTSVENRGLAATLDPAPDPAYVWYRATLAQGWKRQLRRMFGAVEAPILRLVRVRIGIVRLGDLRSGRSRNLKAPEVKAMAGLANAAPTRPSPRDENGSVTPGRHRPDADRQAPVRPHKGRPQGARTPAAKPRGSNRRQTSRHRET